MSEENKHRRTIAERLKRARIEAGLTQKQAAKLFGVSQSVISMQENGIRRVSADTAERMKTTYSMLTRRRTNSKSQPLPGAEAAEVLLQLAALGGNELEYIADNYIALCSYILIRDIYCANPDNYETPFRLDTPLAIMLREQLTDELEKIRKYITYSKNVKTHNIVPDDLLEQRLTNVVRNCEDMITGRNKKPKKK